MNDVSYIVERGVAGSSEGVPVVINGMGREGSEELNPSKRDLKVTVGGSEPKTGWHSYKY